MSGIAPPRPVFVITLRPEPGIDGVRAVRALLKLALRTLGLKCIAITTTDSEGEKC